MQDITVIGAGYVGLVTAVGLASTGLRVTVVENDPDRIASLRRGVVPIHEADLQEDFTTATSRGLLRAAGEVPSESLGIVFLCVGTPINDRGQADLTALEGSLRSIRHQVDDGATVVIRSTLPLGTTTALIDELGLPPRQTLTNPEFLRQGTALADFRAPSRVVIGACPEPDPTAVAAVRAVFEPFGAPVLVVGYEDAEAIKNASNAFLALKLSFANEIAALCEAYGADADAVLDGVGRDPRIGRQFLRPSFGFGGSCLPKELQTVAMAGMQRGLEMHVTAAAAESNLAHQDRFAARIERLLGASRGSRVAMLGLAFKANTDDVRSSPALRVAKRLLAAGISVAAYDPAASARAARELPSVDICASAAEAIDGADLVAVTTEWPEFASLDWPSLVASMRTKIVVDGRRLLDPAIFPPLGAHYERIGSAAATAP